LTGWTLALLAGIAAMHWGSQRTCDAMTDVCERRGLPAVAGGALMGLATASPEITVNAVSVAFSWPDLGLGAALGSNVPALPLIFLLAMLSRRLDPGTDAPPRVQPKAVVVQAAPYLAVVLLLGLLTLPPRWEGLQPIDGFILLGAFVLYLLHAMRQPGDSGKKNAPLPSLKRVWLGLPAIAAGGIVSVIAAKRVAEVFGLSDLVTGLFLIGFLCALPECFATWRLVRDRETTTAIAGAMGDGIVSLTLALMPPALVGAVVGSRVIYMTNLGYLALVILAYIAWNRRREGEEIVGGKVAALVGSYAIYLCGMVVLVRL
jgi:cation:H+ antiporter